VITASVATVAMKTTVRMSRIVTTETTVASVTTASYQSFKLSTIYMVIKLEATDVKAIKLKWEHQALKFIRGLTKKDLENALNGDTFSIEMSLSVEPSWAAYIGGHNTDE
jgi:hypothetical protein